MQTYRQVGGTQGDEESNEDRVRNHQASARDLAAEEIR